MLMTMMLRDAAADQLGLLVWLDAYPSICLFFATITFIASLTAALYLTNHSRSSIYLVDYACFRPDSSYRASSASVVESFHLSQSFNGADHRFLTRISERSGLGSNTYHPPSHQYIPPVYSLGEARGEAELPVFTAIDDLLDKTSITTGAITILVVSCSLFTPTPSLADMIVRRYKLGGGIYSVQLSGMGCSAGLIAVDLATNLLKNAPPCAHALLVSTEVITGNYYTGRKHGMQLSNMLFRTGGAAALLSNSGANARFRLAHVVRRCIGSQDDAYRCVFHEEDEEGNLGLNLSRDLVAVAGEALKANVAAVGRLVLPISVQLSFLFSAISSKVINRRTKLSRVPDFRVAFEHFCIHAGGRAVIDAVQRSLRLSDEQAEPSRMTLHRFGNTSSSSLWYELAYIEAKGRVRSKDRVWMIAFGSGYKCNSAVWKCIHPAQKVDRAWADSIDQYPIDVRC